MSMIGKPACYCSQRRRYVMRTVTMAPATKPRQQGVERIFNKKHHSRAILSHDGYHKMGRYATK